MISAFINQKLNYIKNKFYTPKQIITNNSNVIVTFRLLFLILLHAQLLSCIKSEAQNWQWLKHFGGKGNDEARSFKIGWMIKV